MLSEADASNPIWRRALPDLAPGSTAQRQSLLVCRTTERARPRRTPLVLPPSLGVRVGDPEPTQDAAGVAIAVDAAREY